MGAIKNPALRYHGAKFRLAAWVMQWESQGDKAVEDTKTALAGEFKKRKSL